MKVCVAEETAAAEAARVDPAANPNMNPNVSRNVNTNLNINSATGRARKPRRSNKSVGIGFANLARSIAKDWKDLDATTRAPYVAIAAREKNRYNAEMLLWRAKQQEQEQLLRVQRRQQQQQQQPVPLTPLAEAAAAAVHQDISRRMLESSSGSGDGSPASLHTHSSRSGSGRDSRSNGRQNSIQSQLGIEQHEEVAATVDRYDQHSFDQASAHYHSFMGPFESNMASASGMLAQHLPSTDGMARSREGCHLANMMEVPDQRHQQQQRGQLLQESRNTDMMTPGPTTSSVAISTSTTTNTTSCENLLLDEQSSSSLLIEQQERQLMLQQEQIIRQRQFLQQQQIQYQHLLLHNRDIMTQQHHQQQSTSFGDAPLHLDFFDAPNQYQHQLPTSVRRQSWSAGTTLNTPPIGTEARASSAGAGRVPPVHRIQGFPGRSLNPTDAWFETMNTHSSLSHSNPFQSAATATTSSGQLNTSNMNHDKVAKSFPSDWFQIQDLDIVEDDHNRLSTNHNSTSSSNVNLFFSHQGDIVGKLSATIQAEPFHGVRIQEEAETNKRISGDSSNSEQNATPFRPVLPTSAATATTSTKEVDPLSTETAHAACSVEPSSLEANKPEFDQDTIDFLNRVANGRGYHQ